MGRDQLRNRADPPAARGTGGPHSADIVGSLNISAFNLRIAIGAVLGGRVVASSGVHTVTWVGAIVVSISVGLASINALGTRRARLAGT
jgi:predicted MFS family arabinose efflux permease